MKTQRKKLLVHLHVPPIPPDSGSARRSLGHLQYFKERSDYFEVDAIGCQSFDNLLWSREHEEALSGLVNNLYVYKIDTFDYIYSHSKSFYHQRLLKQQLPIGCDYYSPPGYVNFAKRIIKANQYDIIWANGGATENWVCHSGISKIKTIIDIHDIASNNCMAMKDFGHRKGLKFDFGSSFKKEVEILNQYNAVVINSTEEVDQLRAYLPPHKLIWIPHSVENRNISTEIPCYKDRTFQYDLLFIGNGKHQPNVEGINFFLKEIFPKIAYHKPDVKMAIAGTVCQFLQVPDDLQSNIDRLGFLPELATVYLQSRVMLCPLLNGAGTKVKLQEAMAYSVPIVTTSVGASGLNLVNGSNALIADNPDLFAQSVLQVINQPALAEHLATGVTTTFQQNYSNTAVYSKLDQLFNLLI